MSKREEYHLPLADLVGATSGGLIFFLLLGLALLAIFFR